MFKCFGSLLAVAFNLTFLLQATDVSTCSNRLGLDLMKVLAEENQSYLYSPFSIYSCFSMVASGAEGDTQKEIAATLHWESERDEMAQAHLDLYEKLMTKTPVEMGFALETTNALFLDSQLKLLKPFEKMLTSQYQASILALDFQDTEKATQSINEWVELATHKKIQQLLMPGDLNRDSQIVLLNTLYFKGKWAFPFEPQATYQEPFFYKPNASIDVPMMHQTAWHGYFEDNDFQVVAIPFKQPLEDVQVVLMIALPKQAWPSYDHELNLDLKTWIQKKQKHKINLSLPHLHLHERLDLLEPLTSLGMGLAFTSSADFSSMTDAFHLTLGKAIHEVSFDLDEYGLEAAAATAASMQRTSIDTNDSPVFSANRPFFFFLVEEKTQTVLFQGKYAYPSQLTSRIE